MLSWGGFKKDPFGANHAKLANVLKWPRLIPNDQVSAVPTSAQGGASWLVATKCRFRLLSGRATIAKP